MQPVSRRLKFYRERANLTPNALSELTGVEVSDILDFEKGRQKPSMEVLTVFAHVCDVSVDELLLFQTEPVFSGPRKDTYGSLEDDSIYIDFDHDDE